MISTLFRRGAAAIAGTALLFLSVGANAIEISVDPSTQMVNPGDPVTIDVNISGLGAFAAPSVSVFDIDVDFDTAVLSFDSVVFGNGLDLFGLGSFQSVVGAGPVNVIEVSFESVADLDALQPDAFTLFTMTFDALAEGTGPIGLTVFELGDSLGNPLGANVTGGEVVITPVQAAPEPATIVLLGIGVVGMGFLRRRRMTA